MSGRGARDLVRISTEDATRLSSPFSVRLMPPLAPMMSPASIHPFNALHKNLTALHNGWNGGFEQPEGRFLGACQNNRSLDNGQNLACIECGQHHEGKTTSKLHFLLHWYSSMATMPWNVWEIRSTEEAEGAIEGALESVCFCSVKHCLIEVDLD